MAYFSTRIEEKGQPPLDLGVKYHMEEVFVTNTFKNEVVLDVVTNDKGEPATLTDDQWEIVAVRAAKHNEEETRRQLEEATKNLANG